ncbi:hypothetical protein BAG01nite_48380 [Brevibacillus agri]|uniref:Uncharacterized protein n=1 Tax=Brevibacillus agri TaxID=51101 RepID=A0A3M8AL98_9BACL|nr:MULTISPECIES: hypothetical protein [Brevibacillus]MED3501742.1 hypothetical protein [Brevibacillus agri]QAV15769.1 hypothetical protein BA6348_25245 [Brevibacillus agri]QHZ58462.1 hypothetical protein M655_024035 [Brevibacillus sp. NSP2.1]RNB51982.1 hypothetical protein EB820_19455 [Brevibacillus agri]GED28736.1 hypothetical protein BAG01nite_48380 [Brevibacillus agri]
MIEFTHKSGHGQIELIEDGSVRFNMMGDDHLLQTLQLEFSKGIPSLKAFQQKGIPGKMRGYRKIERTEDLLTLLKSFQEHYPQFDIMIKHKVDSQEFKKRYTLLKWNGEYGADAIFIVRDNWKAKQSLFTPGRCEDLFWFHADLANDPSVSSWEDFGEESFDDLEPIAF